MTHLAPEDLQRRQYSARARRRAALAALHYYTQHAPLVASKRVRERRKHGQALRRQERDHVVRDISLPPEARQRCRLRPRRGVGLHVELLLAAALSQRSREVRTVRNCALLATEALV